MNGEGADSRARVFRYDGNKRIAVGLSWLDHLPIGSSKRQPGQRPRCRQRRGYPEDARRRLGITSRADLVTRLYQLLCGDHSKGYAALRSRCTDPEWVERVLEDLDKTVDKSTMDVEMCWRVHRFLNNDRGIQDVEFAAWDLMCAAMLTRSGFALDWLSEDEAWDTLALINHALQMHYSSWAEAWEAYRLGRWLWAAEGPEEEAADDMHDRARSGLT